jgi:uncharacterized protein YdeI (BOF family)
MAHPCHSAVLKAIFPLAGMLLSVLATFVSTAVEASAPAKAKIISIAEARGLPSGTVVTVEGSVTVPSGTFKSSISDEGFALQDRSGGIYVSMSINLGLGVGVRARVTGKLVESNGLLRVVPANAGSIRARGRGPQVRPEIIQTGHVNEMTEGRLVKVTGTMSRPVVSDSPYGFRLFVDDGTGEIQVYVSTSARIDLSGLQPGQRLSVTGIGGQYKDHYEVDPRFQADVERQ